VKSVRAWAPDLATEPLREGIETERAQSGETTARVQGVYLHSRYRPREEAARLIDDAGLSSIVRAVLVVGIGCGYHVAELIARGYRVTIFEPDRCVAKIAIESALADSDVMLAIGDPDQLIADSDFLKLTRADLQILVHPPTERLHPEVVAAVRRHVASIQIVSKSLSVAVVGPMYGGSLPIASYLARAFEHLGHRTLFVDTSDAWDLYQRVTGTVRSKNASGQLGSLLANVLEQWAYAQVAEFAPNICIVMAQAPVGPSFPARLCKENIVSAFWFVENWRHMPYWRQVCREYDCFFHLQPGEFELKLEEAGCRRHTLVQTGCDPDVHKPVELSHADQNEFGCEVAFAGAGYNNRSQFLLGLTDYHLRIWGTEWNARELQPFLSHPEERFTPETFAKIVAGASINLNLHSSATHSGVDPRCDAVNPRVFEIAACGGFQICDPCNGLSNFFDFESELPVYRDLKQCRTLIDHFLKAPDERRVLADNARNRALREHTYTHRAQQMLDNLTSLFAGQMLAKGVRVQRTVSEMAERAGKESPLGRYLSTLPPNTLFSQTALNNFIPVMGTPLSHPEGVFAYLRELRTSAEQLLALFDGA